MHSCAERCHLLALGPDRQQCGGASGWVDRMRMPWMTIRGSKVRLWVGGSPEVYVTGWEHMASLVCVGSVCGIRTSLLGAEHFRGWALRRGTVILETHVMASLCSSAVCHSAHNASGVPGVCYLKFFRSFIHLPACHWLMQQMCVEHVLYSHRNKPQWDTIPGLKELASQDSGLYTS